MYGLLFNSLAFGAFMPIVFILYWILQKGPLKLQNFFLIAASYAFYAYWDYRFLSLVIVSSVVCYVAGLWISKTEEQSRRKTFLIISLVINLGILAFFKYYNFFITSFSELLRSVGINSSISTLQLILPLGISFYTFKVITYTVDIYRREMEPTKDIAAFFAFVSFFPTMIAGPIDRARNLLPQFLKKRVFSDPEARDGLRQMLNGFLKKMVIADNLAPFTDDIFNNYAQYDGLTLLIGAFFFAIQIYCDFSGYSDIAIGTARLLGFKVMRNFNYPYFSRDIAEFWRRWHISLSTWFRDYLYVPLCGRKPSKWKKARNIIITFALCGLWHGANWTFVAWGVLLGLYFLPITVVRTKHYLGTAGEGRIFPSFREAGAMLGTFLLVLIAWIFFKSNSIGDAAGYLSRMISHPFMKSGYTPYLPMILASIALFGLEWIQRRKKFILQTENLPVVIRWLVYYLSAIVLLVFGAFGSNEFIYFQF